MTSPVTSRAVQLDEVPARRPGRSRPVDPARVLVRIARAMWFRDRPVAEARWGAITLVVMAILAAGAIAIDPADAGFWRALIVTAPLSAVAVLLAWAPVAPRIFAHGAVRLAIGPAVVAVALVAGGTLDVVTLEAPSARPFMILALAFAAITISYPLAAVMSVVVSLGVVVLHIVFLPDQPVDVPTDEYVVQVAVVLLASVGMYTVVRIATTAEEHAARLAARSRRRVDDLETLGRILRRFDGSRSVQDVVQSVVEDVSQAFEIALVSIYVPQGPTRLTMVGVAGYHSPFHEIDVGVGIIGRAASSRTTQFVADVLADPDYRAARDDVRNEVAAPILLDDELLGVVNFEGTLARPIGTRHVALAEMLARTMAGSLRQARLDDERRERLHAIERVLEVSRGLVGDLDRGRTLHAVVDAAADLLGTESVVIATRDADGEYVIEHETPASGGIGRRLDADDDVAMEAIRSGEPRICERGRAVLALPIRIDDAAAAVLVATRAPGSASFGPLEASIADLLATQVAVALRNADRHATVSDAVMRDPLTGLRNRRYFDEAVETAFAEARRTDSALSLIVLDLDRFSAVNNEHGHPVGDAVLRLAARAMTAAVRSADVVIRYGGEEFVVLAPGVDRDAAVIVAERIRASVAGASQDATESPAITVSAGVASLIGDELDGHALFRAADSALLAAKRAGRDRTVAVQRSAPADRRCRPQWTRSPSVDIARISQHAPSAQIVEPGHLRTSSVLAHDGSVH